MPEEAPHRRAARRLRPASCATAGLPVGLRRRHDVLRGDGRRSTRATCSTSTGPGARRWSPGATRSRCTTGCSGGSSSTSATRRPTPSRCSRRSGPRTPSPVGAARSRRPSRGESGDEEEVSLGLMASDAEVLRNKSFAACTPEELAALRRIMARIRLTPPRRAPGGRRRARAAAGPTCAGRSGRPCARTASRPSCSGVVAGCGMRPLVLILDVSGSMSDYSRNLLQFAYSHEPRRGPGRGLLLRHAPHPHHRRPSSAAAPTTRWTQAARAVVRLGGRHPDRRLAGRVRARLGAAGHVPGRASW